MSVSCAQKASIQSSALDPNVIIGVLATAVLGSWGVITKLILEIRRVNKDIVHVYIDWNEEKGRGIASTQKALNNAAKGLEHMHETCKALIDRIDAMGEEE